TFQFFLLPEMSSPPQLPKFSPKSDCSQILSGINLDGKVILITGTTSGIGIPTAKYLALAGAHVIIANRNIVQSQDQIKEIKDQKNDAKVDFINTDLSSLDSVVAAANTFKSMNLPLHILILNAGVFSPERKATLDNFETAFGVNHVAHTLLVTLLIDILKASAPARIVFLSSSSHAHHGIDSSLPLESKLDCLCPSPESTAIGYKLYSLSKMCNFLTVRKLHRLYSDEGISTYAVHPGACIPTNIGRTYGLGGRIFFKVASLFTKNLSQGASTTVLCAVRPEVEKISGKYWQDCREAEDNTDPLANDEQLQDALYDRTMEITKKYVK
ncbi:hypothetical protein PFISCL1PPCAC_6183, partial [Pristionchus fissidentatus]